MGAVIFHPRTVKCSSCPALIFWAMSPAGKRMPVDSTSTPGGEYVIENFIEPLQLSKFDVENHEHAKLQRWTSHFRTCPNATSHSKKGSK